MSANSNISLRDEEKEVEAIDFNESYRLESPSGDRKSTLERIILPIARRGRIEPQKHLASTLSLPPERHLRTRNLRVIQRLFVWSYRIIRFFSSNFLDDLLRRADLTTQARRFREALERMGPTAIKVGQQLSVRADLLPYQYCDELGKMLDQVPPFPLDHAIKSVELATGKPLYQTFLRFDPIPIGSASLASVYQAILPMGKRVAIKVKRPNIDILMATDLKAISWLCKSAEALGLIRTGLTQNFMMELSRMLREELDFDLEARYTDIFRRESRKYKHVSAPRVFQDLSNSDVLVTEFVAGVFLNEMLYAIEHQDKTALDQLLARGFRPKTIGKRMMRIFHWECFESHFFHADPHPANIIVRPDNTLIMIDFGSCGSISSRMKRKLLSFNRYMVDEDLHGMAQTTVSMLEPLPHFDVHNFSNELMNIYRRIFIAHRSKNAPWYDKCSGGMWMKVIMLSQKFHLPMTLDTVRIFRASFMYDSIIYRLFPNLDPQREFKKWAKLSDRKNRRRSMRAISKRLAGPLDPDFTRQREIDSLFASALERFQRYLDQPSYNFGLTIGKVAYVVKTSLKTLVVTLGFALVISSGRILYDLALRPEYVTEQPLMQAIFWTVNNKLFIIAFTIYCIIEMRKILFKLEDIEPD